MYWHHKEEVHKLQIPYFRGTFAENITLIASVFGLFRKNDNRIILKWIWGLFRPPLCVNKISGVRFDGVKVCMVDALIRPWYLATKPWGVITEPLHHYLYDTIILLVKNFPFLPTSLPSFDKVVKLSYFKPEKEKKTPFFEKKYAYDFSINLNSPFLDRIHSIQKLSLSNIVLKKGYDLNDSRKYIFCSVFQLKCHLTFYGFWIN